MNDIKNLVDKIESNGWVHNIPTSIHIRPGRLAENIAIVSQVLKMIQIDQFHVVLSNWAYPRVPNGEFCINI